MASEWPLVSVENLQDPGKGAIAIGPFGSRMKSDCYVNAGIPVIRGTNISGGRSFEGQFVHITKEKADSLGSSNVFQGDLVFPHRGSIGEVGLVQGVGRYVLSSSLMKLTCDKSKADPLYLYYFFRSAAGRHELLKNASQVGTPGIGQPLSSLKSITVPLPPLRAQVRIGNVLSVLDDKIELNRQINQTLESMAQALFKSWFVDFDPVIDNMLAAGKTTPDALAAKATVRRKQQTKTLPAHIRQLFPSDFQFTEELGWIPEGWMPRTVDSLVDLIGGGTPKTSVPEYWDGNIPWFSVVDAPNPSDIFAFKTEKHITELGLANSSARLLPIGTTIISARGTVGKCAMTSAPMTVNQSCYGVRGVEGIANTFVYYMVYLSVADLQQNSHGSVFSTITRDTFKTIKIAFGDGELTRIFDKVVEAHFDTISANLYEIETLSELRDILLPKLLSGELRIPEAEQQLEKALA